VEKIEDHKSYNTKSSIIRYFRSTFKVIGWLIETSIIEARDGLNEEMFQV